MNGVLQSPLDRLIAALARKAVAEHLTRQTAPDRESTPSRANRVQLPDTRKAA